MTETGSTRHEPKEPISELETGLENGASVSAPGRRAERLGVDAEAGSSERVVRRDLPCVGCGYNLKGISPGGVCPECGLGVQRTLLYVVDPAASEIAPLRNGRWLGLILVLVPALLMGSAIIQWAPHVEFAIENYNGIVNPQIGGNLNMWKGVAGFLAIVSGLLTFGLQNPTGRRVRRTYLSGLWMARLGLFFWGVTVVILAVYDATHGTWRASLYDREQIDVFRSVLRISSHLSLGLVVLGFPPVLRFVALRSLYHRVVQVSRQGFLAMGVALVIVIGGDLLWIITWWVETGATQSGEAAPLLVDRLGLFSSMLVLVGSGMLTLALFNSTMDALRLAMNINRPRYRMDEVVD